MEQKKEKRKGKGGKTGEDSLLKERVIGLNDEEGWEKGREKERNEGGLETDFDSRFGGGIEAPACFRFRGQ